MKTVLFVCVGNSCRSQMAEGFFNKLFKPEGWMAMSAGTEPADAISSHATDAMKEVRIDISGQRPKMLTLEMLESADKVITMGCGVECPVTFIESEDWGLEDPWGKQIEKYREMRDKIREKVKILAGRL